MATIRVCDWTKKVLAKDEDVFVIEIEGNEGHKFEVGREGRDLLRQQLEGEEEPGAAQTVEVERVVYRDRPPQTLRAGPPGIDVEVSGDPFDSGPSSMPQPVQSSVQPRQAAFDLGAVEDASEFTPLEIPDSGKKKFKPPTITQADKVVADSTLFREGSLAALNPGADAQREANAKMRAMRDRDTNLLNSKANHGIRLKDLNE